MKLVRSKFDKLYDRCVMCNMKAILVFIFGLILFALPTVVRAEKISGLKKPTSCISEKTCLVLCSYENDTQAGRISASYIYYDFSDSKFYAAWGNQTKYPEVSNVLKYDEVLSHKYLYWANKGAENGIYTKLKESGICPALAFVDGQGAVGELCFDEAGGKYCVDGDPGAWFCKFEGTSKKTYDHSSDLQSHINVLNNDINSIKVPSTCSELLASVDVEAKISGFYDKFRTNYLYGNEIPVFIANNPNFKSTTEHFNQFVQSMNTDVKNLTSACIEESKKDESLSEEERNNRIDEYNRAAEKITAQAKRLVETMSAELNVQPTLDADCKLIRPRTEAFLKTIMNFIRYLVPVIILITTTVDYLKAVTSHDQDKIKKATANLAKRLIIGVIVFIVPTVLEYILGLIEYPYCSVLN